MKNSLRKSLIAAFFCMILACVCAFAAMTMFPAHAEESPLKMIEGASIRHGDTEEDMGIRFSAEIDKTAYEELAQTYTISAGVFFMPSEYVEKFTAITEASTFNDDTAVFTWAGHTGGGLVTILHLDATPYLTKSVSDATKEVYRVNGSVVNMLPENLSRDYVGVCYLKCVKDGETKYIFADCDAETNGRSVMEVALNIENNEQADENESATADTYLGCYFEDFCEHFNDTVWANEKYDFQLPTIGSNSFDKYVKVSYQDVGKSDYNDVTATEGKYPMNFTAEGEGHIKITLTETNKDVTADVIVGKRDLAVEFIDPEPVVKKGTELTIAEEGDYPTDATFTAKVTKKGDNEAIEGAVTISGNTATWDLENSGLYEIVYTATKDEKTFSSETFDLYERSEDVFFDFEKNDESEHLGWDSNETLGGWSSMGTNTFGCVQLSDDWSYDGDYSLYVDPWHARGAESDINYNFGYPNHNLNGSFRLLTFHYRLDYTWENLQLCVRVLDDTLSGVGDIYSDKITLRPTAEGTMTEGVVTFTFDKPVSEIGIFYLCDLGNHNAGEKRTTEIWIDSLVWGNSKFAIPTFTELEQNKQYVFTVLRDTNSKDVTASYRKDGDEEWTALTVKSNNEFDFDTNGKAGGYEFKYTATIDGVPQEETFKMVVHYPALVFDFELNESDERNFVRRADGLAAELVNISDKWAHDGKYSLEISSKTADWYYWRMAKTPETGGETFNALRFWYKSETAFTTYFYFYSDAEWKVGTYNQTARVTFDATDENGKEFTIEFGKDLTVADFCSMALECPYDPSNINIPTYKTYYFDSFELIHVDSQSN